jgi:putative (di)nucleoside polyphosphate hydrolase
MIDAAGYRANVGIILANDYGQLFWGRRAGMNAWQFPQGGIRRYETVESAMFRELHEETGLDPEDVKILGYTREWLRYRLPRRYVRKRDYRPCIGQKQKWYLLHLLDESKIRLDIADRPEFDRWRWIEFWRPAQEVVEFKQQVYQKALRHFEPILFASVR